MRRFFWLPLFIILTSPVSGHHSDAGLERDSVLALEGTVVEYSWRNPHVYITINTTDESGSEVEWNLEAGAIAVLSRQGWTRDSIAVGEKINVEVNPARDGRPYGGIASITREDGTAIVGEPDRAIPEPNRVAKSLEGVWGVDRTNLVRYPDGSFGYFMANLQLTEKARAAHSVYDSESDQNPVYRCIGHPEPFITVLATVFPLEIRFNEEESTVSIRSSAIGFHQTVYLDGRDHPENGERTNIGHAIGWWEDDTLVVDTRLFADHRDAYHIGVPSGAQKHVVQRYRLIKGGTRLEVAFTLEDPEFIAEPLSDTREMIYVSGAEIVEWDCDLESAQRFLN
jgi:hypothetical protein